MARKKAVEETAKEAALKESEEKEQVLEEKEEAGTATQALVP